jgi:hypothetical protein
MPINFTITHETIEEAIADMKLLTIALGGGSPPMQEQPKENREPAPANDDKPARKPRAKKGETETPLESDGAASSKETAAETNTSEESSTAEIPDIEFVRARLKQMGATDGLGHDKVFETLAHYKSKDNDKEPAKSASTLRPADYNALLAEIDELLKGAAK